MQPIVQINLQRNYGGGETYTKTLILALSELNRDLYLVTHPKALFWSQLNLPASLKIKGLNGTESFRRFLNDFINPGILLSHGPLYPQLLTVAKSCGWEVMAICHMPPQGRRRNEFNEHQLVFGVSDYVIEGLRRNTVNTWPTALLGAADLSLRGASDGTLRKTSEYVCDSRKIRDVIFCFFYNKFYFWRPKVAFVKKPGITLGIFSGITPIKQFPTLFSILAPIISKYPRVNLEIFGGGGYASVRDLKLSLAPCKGQVRFWGKQVDPKLVFRNIDFLMAGLPEKEALGLNIIEAQFANVPVLAVRAPPFVQTVLENKTGIFFRDPRDDQGEDFHAVLGRILAEKASKLEPLQHPEHLESFSFRSFKARLSQTPLLLGDISHERNKILRNTSAIERNQALADLR